MLTRRATTAVAAASVLLVLAGCGGRRGQTTSPDTSSTSSVPSALADRFKALSLPASTALRAFQRDAIAANTQQEADDVRAFDTASEVEFAALRTLPASAPVKTDIEGFIATTEALIRDLDAFVAPGGQPDVTTFNSDVNHRNDAVDRLNGDFGLPPGTAPPPATTVTTATTVSSSTTAPSVFP